MGSVVKYLPKTLPLRMLVPVHYTWLGGASHLLVTSSGPLFIPPSSVWWVNCKACRLQPLVRQIISSLFSRPSQGECCKLPGVADGGQTANVGDHLPLRRFGFSLGQPWPRGRSEPRRDGFQAQHERKKPSPSFIYLSASLAMNYRQPDASWTVYDGNKSQMAI